MRKYKLFILALFLMLPISVNAHEITCDAGTLNYLDKFNCYLKTSGGEFDQISGTLEVDNPNVTCNLTSTAPNLTNTKTSPEFFIQGKATPNTAVATFGCQVTGKVEAGQTAQLLINDYKYHIKGVTYLPTELVLRSDYLMLAPYVEATTTTKPSKPKDTSNIRSTLKSVSDENVKINFSRITLDYRIEVLYEVEQLNLVVYPYDINATYEIVGDQKLKVGENTIDIYVTSPDGTSKTCYTFVFIRLPRGQEIYYKESDSTLADLKIEGHEIKFEPKVLEYTIEVTYKVNEIDVTATPTVATATAEITGTKNLTNGSKVFVNVTSQDGTSTTRYIINVKKGSPPKDYTKEIILGIVIIIVILLFVLIINTSKKEKNDDLLKLKHDKRKVKKGKNFDVNDVPEVGMENDIPVPQEPNKVVSAENPQNVVLENNAAAQPIQVTTPVDTNLNKVTPVQASISLETTEKAQPMQVTGPVVVENTVVSGLDEKAPTLDLSNASVESSMLQPNVNPLQEVQPIAPQMPIDTVGQPIMLEQNTVVPIPVQQVVVPTPTQAPVQQVVTQPVMTEPQMIVTEPQVVIPTNVVQEPIMTPVQPEVVINETPVVTDQVIYSEPIVQPQVQEMVVPQAMANVTPVVEPVMAPTVEPVIAPSVEETREQYVTQQIIIPPSVEEPVVEDNSQQYVTQQIIIPTEVVAPVTDVPVESTLEPLAQEPAMDPVIEQQTTSVIPITPTSYKLPEDQELQATQALQILNQTQGIDNNNQIQ